MHKMSGNVTQGRSPFVQEDAQVTRLAMSEGVPKSYEEVRESIDWKTIVIFLREILATMHRRLEEMAALSSNVQSYLEVRQRGSRVSEVTERRCRESCRQKKQRRAESDSETEL